MPDGTTPGRVIVLNGTTSAGKSTLAAKVQERLAAEGQCWIVMGIDDALGRLPAEWVTVGDHVGAHADDGIAFTVVDGAVTWRVGPTAARLLAAYRGSVRATVDAGDSVIVDEVLLAEADWRGWQHALAGIDTLWVRVDCAPDVAEARERVRGDRMVGLASAQIDVVHRHPDYDVVVDTVALDAGAPPTSCTRE